MTSTYTHYFDDTAITTYRQAIEFLREDWEERKSFCSKDVVLAIETRLAMLDSCLTLLVEPVI